MAHILIAEDVEEIRFAYEAILMSAGHTVETAANGEGAINKLKTSKFNLLITDLLMPKGDGFDVIEETLSLVQKPKILVITGGGDQLSPHAAIKLRESKIDRFLVKPVDRDILLNTVDALLN
jgi:two-component system, OmpR family, response regulator